MNKVNEKYVKKLLPKRPKDSYKGTFGHVLNIAGSGTYTGAAYFSSISSLKSGCGLTTLASVETVIRAVSALTPDVILMELEETRDKKISPRAIKQLEPILDKYQAISLGCGLSTTKDTINFFEKLINILKKLRTPVIIDADGLNILSGFENIVLPQNTVLTPHPKELSKLMGINTEDVLLQPEFWVKKCCEKYDCITVLKLHKTLVSDNNNFYINNTGNSALSHGGSGDILCGMISGFLAQGLNCFDASVLSVYLHGRAAVIVSKDLTEYSTLSSDLINYIPKAIKSII